MNILDKLKNIERKKFISYLFIFIILIYSLSFTILFYSVFISLYQTIESIKIPDSYYIIIPSSENPDVRISYTISNEGYFEITKFQIYLSLDIIYYEEYSNEKKNVTFFEKIEKHSVLSPRKSYYDVIQGNQEDFNISALENFENCVNTSKEINFLIDIKIEGYYFFNLIPFSIIVKDLNPECPTCS